MNTETTNVTSTTPSTLFPRTYFHGTKADLQPGDIISVGHPSNYVERNLKHVYVSGTIGAAIWGAELARGQERERIYLVEATGPVENDPNLTDKKFPGNPSMSYRSVHPFKVIGEVCKWQGHSDEQILTMKTELSKLACQGIQIIEE